MPRALRLLALLIVPALLLGVPAGWALGAYAAGDAVPTRLSGYRPPDIGAEGLSAGAADAVQPADIAYIPQDRYTAAAQRFAD